MLSPLVRLPNYSSSGRDLSAQRRGPAYYLEAVLGEDRQHSPLEAPRRAAAEGSVPAAVADGEGLAKEWPMQIEGGCGDAARFPTGSLLDGNAELELQVLRASSVALSRGDQAEERVARRLDRAIDVPELGQSIGRVYRLDPPLIAELLFSEPDDRALREFPETVEADHVSGFVARDATDRSLDIAACVEVASGQCRIGFEEFSTDELSYLAAKAARPRKLVLDTAKETVPRFNALWRKREDALGLPARTIELIDSHVKRMPITGEAP